MQERKNYGQNLKGEIKSNHSEEDCYSNTESDRIMKNNSRQTCLETIYEPETAGLTSHFINYCSLFATVLQDSV